MAEPQAGIVPASGMHYAKNIPGPAHRRSLLRPVHKIRTCRDGRPYAFIPFTIQGELTVDNFGPMWRVDRDYWIARITANVGRHVDADHPDDGCPQGSAIKVQMHRVNVAETDDDPILASGNRLNIPADHHRDAVNDDEDGSYVKGDFLIHRLNEHQHIYPEITQVGSTYAGSGLVVTAVLVPIP